MIYIYFLVILKLSRVVLVEQQKNYYKAKYLIYHDLMILVILCIGKYLLISFFYNQFYVTFKGR
jgi:hypothetical protein